MKTLIVLISLMSFKTYACKMNPLPKCQGVEKKITISPERLSEIRDDLNRFQISLDANLTEPKKRSSCFNNHGAIHYVNELISPTCPSQLQVIKAHVDQLENLIVYVPAQKKEKVVFLKDLLKKIKTDWEKIRG